MNATFFLKGGHKIVVKNVKKVELGNGQDGSFSGYSIVWNNLKEKPSLFSLSIPDIVGVLVEETLWERIASKLKS